MEWLFVIRVFALTIFFNMTLPTGDVYSDLALVIETYNFQNSETWQMLGCQACTDESDLENPIEHDNCLCITQNLGGFYCSNDIETFKKLLYLQNKEMHYFSRELRGFLMYFHPNLFDYLS